MAHRDPRRLSRRQFNFLGTQAVGAVVTVLLGIPIVGFILSPLFRRQQVLWRQVGDISGVPDRQPTKFLVSFPQDEWTTANEDLAVYVVKINSRYLVFSNVCTHMQCPVRWQADLGQFLCPCHGGLYDITGQNIGGPPPKPLPQYVHRIDGSTLFIQNSFTESI
jgi:menaquinol-cytochrome c reductase iron-sulfur subunit